ncbi:MAG: hypothetical protein WAM44_10320, partial [Chthoniobacterales bacterium]
MEISADYADYADFGLGSWTTIGQRKVYWRDARFDICRNYRGSGTPLEYQNPRPANAGFFARPHCT